MNLHGIVRGAVAAVNPLVPALMHLSIGYTTSPDGTRVPQYDDQPIPVMVQMQPLTFGEIQHLDNLNISGEKEGVYVEGDYEGLVRQDKQGGDIMIINGRNYLVVNVLERWPDWCKVAVTRQL